MKQFANAECKINTHGRGGLKGFIAGKKYAYKMTKGKDGNKYYMLRTGPDEEFQDCNEGAFKQYFKS